MTCKIFGCNNKLYRNTGVCKTHYANLTCQVIDCNNSYYCKGFCENHYLAMKRNGHTERLINKKGTWSTREDGYVVLTVGKGKNKMLHVQIVEKAMGKPLPEGAQVHHIDGNPRNNDNKNLIVCPNQAYHMLLHRRQKALEECGNADYCKCWICKKYDAPENLRFYGRNNGSHSDCERSYRQQLNNGLRG